MTEEHRRKISESMKKHRVSAETRKKMSEAKRGNKIRLRHLHTEESKKKISNALKNYHDNRSEEEIMRDQFNNDIAHDCNSMDFRHE